MDGVVFLVDALDRERFVESKAELDGLLSDESLAAVSLHCVLSHSQRPAAC